MDTMIDKTIKNGIDLQLITTTEDFAALKTEWNAVLLQSGIHNAFLTHEWLLSWWKNYGTDKKLMILKFIKDGRVIGFIPLMKYKTKLTGLNVETVGFLTNHWTRMNFILAAHVDECLSSFVDYMKESKETFILAQMDKAHEITQKFGDVLKNEKISFVEHDKSHAYVDLKGTWEDYFNGQSKNFRMDSRRKLKRLEGEGKVVLGQNKGEDAENVLNQLKTIASHCWQAKDNVNIVSTNEGFHFYQDICQSALKGSVLDFSILTVKDKPVAYMVGLVKNDCYFAFDTAYDKNFEQFSPGLILHNLLMERLYKDSIKVFDFGYNASYKKRWSSQTLLVSDCVIFSKGLQGTLLRIGHHLKSMKRTNQQEGNKND